MELLKESKKIDPHYLIDMVNVKLKSSLDGLGFEVDPDVIANNICYLNKDSTIKFCISFVKQNDHFDVHVKGINNVSSTMYDKKIQVNFYEWNDYPLYELDVLYYSTYILRQLFDY